MGMRIGQGGQIQAGFETTWGTPVTPDFNISPKSESLKYTADKKEEESLVGGRASRGMQTLGSKVEGDISILFKPDELGHLLAWSMGDETATDLESGATTATRHTFEPVEDGATPKATVVIDRKVAVDRYTSCKVDSFKLSGAAGGFIEGSVSLRGYDEDTGAIEAGISKSTKKAWRFVDAAVKIDGVSIGALVQGFDIEVGNGLESDLYTLASGTKMSEIEFTKLSVSASLDLLYETQSQALHAGKYKSDTAAEVEITLTSPDEVESGYNYELVITLPVAQISESSFNLADAGRIKHSMKFTGLEDESNSAIVFELVDGQELAYL
jgi:hypothetical protein